MSTTTPGPDDPMHYIYTKTIKCPVCEMEFMDFALRRSRLRATGTDTDLRPNFKVIDPNFYEVLLCNHCGYAALADSFERILERHKELITTKITPHNKYHEFSLPYTAADAITRFKLALTCCQAINAKASTKAILCLKLAWVYRTTKDEKNELLLLRLAYSAFKEAYTTEHFPLGNMDEHTVKYIMAESARRIGEHDEARKLVGELVTNRSTPARLKNMAQDLRELLREPEAE